MRRVVVTGLGVLAPNGHGKSVFSSALREGCSGIRLIPELASLGFSCQVAGVPDDVDTLANSYFDPPTLIGMDRYCIIGCIAGIDAWADAGVTAGRQEVDWDTGIWFGTGIGAIETIARTLVPMTDSGRVRRLGSTMPERIMGSALSARLAGLLGVGGQVSSNSSACSTGTEAIINGYRMIRDGYAQRVLAGGCEGDSRYIWAGFDAMRVLSRNFNDAPQRASRPLSATACGLVPAAGAGAVVLEDLESAIYRGARIYAEIIGAAINCGGQRNGGTMTAGNPEGIQRCIRAAVTSAGIRPSEIDLISGHLTATMADPFEVCSWRSALGLNPDDFPLINAPKSLIGHTLGAAGAIESVASILQLYEGFVHPSINCEDLHPELKWCQGHIPPHSEKKDLRVVAKASFGFGDVNTCIIFSRYESVA